MAEKSHTGLYLTLGVLAAVGAGYLVWRFVLSDDQKAQAKDVVVTGTRKVRGTSAEMEELPIGR
ncbi:MAG: hypothetical protein ABR562_07335 [Thermoplasmatota archaeon]